MRKFNVYVKSYVTKNNEKRFYLEIRRKGYKTEYITLGPVSLKQAEDERIKIHAQLLSDQYQEQSGIAPIADEFCQKFLNYSKGLKALDTVRIYCGNLEKFLDRFTGKRLDVICKEDIECFLSSLPVRKRGQNQCMAANRTKNMMLSTLNLLFDKAVEWKYIKHSPTHGIKRFKERSEGTRPVTEHELQMMLDEATPMQLADIQVAVLTGLRAKALRNLRFDQIDWENRRIKVINKSGDFYFVTMSEQLAEILQHLFHNWPNPKFGSNKKRDMVRYFARTSEQQVYVFCRKDGTPFSKGFRCLKKLYTKLGIDNVALHGLRKTFCTMLARKKVHPRVAQELMGHKTLDMTMRLYTHVGDDQLKEAVNLLPSVTAQPKTKLYLVR